MVHVPTRSKVTRTSTYLKALEHVLEERRLRDKRNLHKMGQQLFDIVKEFVIKKRCLIYGGVALNSILPKKDKFYDKLEIPDIDFFSPTARQHAIELADFIVSKGFRYVEVRSGIHYETFKVYANFLPIADITELPRRLFNRLMIMSEEEKPIIRKYAPGFNLPIAPLAFLRLSMHLELSRPEGYIERWVKVYKRMTLLYDYYPIPYDKSCHGFESHRFARVIQLKPFIMQFIKHTNVPIIGVEAIKMYLQAGGMQIDADSVLDPKMSVVDVISESYVDHAERLKSILTPHLKHGERLEIQYHAPLNKSELLTKHCTLQIVITKNKHQYVYPLIGFYQSTSCYAYKMYRNYKLASIDTLLSFMYAWLLADRSYLNVTKLQCVLSWLLYIQYVNLHGDKKMFHLFEQNCYGTQQQLTDIKKQMWDKGRDKIIYRPTTNI